MLPVKYPLSLIILCLILLLTACNTPRPRETSPATATPPQATPTLPATLAPSVVFTATPTATSQPSATPLLPSPEPEITAETIPTVSTQPVKANGICDQASFVADINVPPGTKITAGTQFDKTWRIKNTGACTWTGDYAIVFDAGEQMSGPEVKKLNEAVPPGHTVDISLSLNAPGQPGEFQSQWKLRNAAGALFGLSANQDQPLAVSVQVVPAPSSNEGYDFITNNCLAEWFSGDRPSACMGVDGDPNGFILTKIHPILENGYIDNEPALLMDPPLIEDGSIYGRYPAFTVAAGDHFMSIIGCEHNAKDCHVRFRLDYQIDAGPMQTLAAWDETYDGKFTQVNLDLSSLAGKNVQFILMVISMNASDQNRALWLHPRIIR